MIVSSPIGEGESKLMLHVNGGRGDTSYASNSLLSRKVMSMTWPIVKEAIADFFHGSTFPTTLNVADLGCSSGPNTLMFVSDVIKQVEDIRQKFHKKPLEYQVFLNDLHGNDFNAIFTSLPSFVEDLKAQVGGGLGPCFFNGVPGSFYGRLFPNKSLHFVYSSYSLHWLSKVPEGIDQNNKGEIFIGSRSPESVVEAYYKQFHKDFSMFLKSRAQELAIGGRMVLTIIGRTSEDPSSQEYSHVWGFLSLALNNMVSEGILGADKVDSFDIPNYMPSPSEVRSEVLNEGSFTIDRLEVSRINWDFYNTDQLHQSNISVDSSYYITQNIRSVVEPLLIRHFGEAIIEELFYRYRKIIDNYMSKKKMSLSTSPLVSR